MIEVSGPEDAEMAEFFLQSLDILDLLLNSAVEDIFETSGLLAVDVLCLGSCRIPREHRTVDLRFPRKSRHPISRLEGRLEGCHYGSNSKKVHTGVQD